METFIDLTSDDDVEGDNKVHHPLQLQAPGSIPIRASISENGGDAAHPNDLEAESEAQEQAPSFFSSNTPASCQPINNDKPEKRVVETPEVNILHQVSPQLRAFLMSNTEPSDNSEPQDTLDLENQVGAGKRKPLSYHAGECRRAFRNAVLCKSIIPDDPTRLLPEMIELVKTILRVEITKILEIHKGIKLWVGLKTVYENDPTGRLTNIVMETPSQIVTNPWAIEPLCTQFEHYFMEKDGNLIRGESNITYNKTESITIKASKWNPLPGSGWKKLPPLLEKKRSLLNIENEDEECLAYCIAAYLLRREAKKAKALAKQGTTTTPVANSEEEDVLDEDYLNDEVQYSASTERNPFMAKEITRLYKPNQYRKHFERFGLNSIKYPIAPQFIKEVEDTLKLKINIFSFFDDQGLARFPMYISEKKYTGKLIYYISMNTMRS